MKIEFDADYIAGYVMMALIYGLAVALLSWFAWNNIGRWQHLRTWLCLGALLVGGPLWVLDQFRKGKDTD